MSWPFPPSFGVKAGRPTDHVVMEGVGPGSLVPFFDNLVGDEAWNAVADAFSISPWCVEMKRPGYLGSEAVRGVR